MVQAFHFDLFADYFQFYLQDQSADGDLGNSWTPDAVERLLAITQGAVGVGTVRNSIVPVDIEVADNEPEIDNSQDWHQINECSIDVPTGCIVVAGCTDYFPDAARIEVTPGTYRVRVYYGNLDSISEDGLDGLDRYKVVLWAAPAATPAIIKQRVAKL